MSLSRKLVVYCILFVAAAITAAIYGALHDQISYALSPEYFTLFKFIQFDMPWAQNTPRLGAALVGALATWWVGVLAFSVLGLFGFMFPTTKSMVKYLLRSFVLVIGVAVVSGVLGLLYGYTRVNDATIEEYSSWVSAGVLDTVQFVRVGIMHNASYMGALAGLLVAIVYLIAAKRKMKSLHSGE